MKKIIWDLFGGGQNSVYLGLKDNQDYEVYTFDLVSHKLHDNQYQVDLSQDINVLIEYFNYFEKPDIIVASPLCQSFSSILNMKGGGTCFWAYEDETKTKLCERSVEEFERLKVYNLNKQNKAETQLFAKRLGEKCINNTIDLIKHFKPIYWYIENPKNSLMWKYIQYNRTDFWNDNFYKNKCYYSAYGFNQPKPTIFLSNIKMDLLNHNDIKIEIKDNQKYLYDKENNLIGKMNIRDKILPNLRKTKYQNKGTFQGKESAKISHIPPLLIKDIFRHFKK